MDLSHDAVDTLRRLQIIKKSETLRRGWRDFPVWCFTGSEGKPLNASGLWKAMKRSTKAAGLPGHFNSKSLRHTFGALLAQAGESPQYIQQQMGHASPVLTMGIYGRWFPTKPLHGGVNALDGGSGSKMVANMAAAGTKVNVSGHLRAVNTSTTA